MRIRCRKWSAKRPKTLTQEADFLEPLSARRRLFPLWMLENPNPPPKMGQNRTEGSRNLHRLRRNEPGKEGTMPNRITSYPFLFVPYFVPRARSARFGGARSARYRRRALRALSGPWALRAHGGVRILRTLNSCPVVWLSDCPFVQLSGSSFRGAADTPPKGSKFCGAAWARLHGVCSCVRAAQSCGSDGFDVWGTAGVPPEGSKS